MTLLQEVVFFSAKEPVILLPNRRTRRLAYYCTPITPPTTAGTFYQRVANKDDLALYTTDTAIASAFDEGLTEVYLLYEGFDNDSIDVVNENCYTLAVHNTGTVVPLSVDFTRFEGLIFYEQSGLNTFLDGTNEYLSYSLLYGTGVFLGKADEDLMIRVLANAISEERNPNWLPLQYKQYPLNTSLLTNNTTQVPELKGKQISFIANDNNTFVIPSLFWFRAGGLEVMDYYIAEDILIDIQIATANYILNNNPRYTNDEIGNLTALGLDILSRYLNEGKINAGDYVIPSRQQQSPADIIGSVVNDAELIISRAGSIWQVKGTAEQTFQDTNLTQSTQGASVSISKIRNKSVSTSKCNFSGLKMFNQIKLEKRLGNILDINKQSVASRAEFYKSVKGKNKGVKK